MTRQKSILGAVVLAALCFAAFGASGASAAKSSLHECLESTKGTESKGMFKDAECKTSEKGGKFMTVPIAEKQSVTATQTSNFVLEAAPLGIKNKITCEEMMSSETTVENVAGGGFKGEGKTTFSKCTVNEPAGCTVVEPIETVKLKAESEDTEAGVMRTKYTPASGTAFVTITLGNCGLLNGGHTVNGVARSEVVNTETEKFDGASGSELTFFGAAAKLTGSLHFTTTDGKKIYRETP